MKGWLLEERLWVFVKHVFPLLEWRHAQGKGRHKWKRMDMCSDRQEDRRATSLRFIYTAAFTIS